MSEFKHIPVLLHETIEALALRPGLTVVDATLGGGGHALAVLNKITPDGRIIAFDRDELSIRSAEKKFAGQPVELRHENYCEIFRLAEPVDRVLFDLGVSSPQLDLIERGFSWKNKASLDMRMDQNRKLTAEEIVNTYPENRLADLIFEYGEERFSRRIAKGIVYYRAQAGIRDSEKLKEIIVKSIPGSYKTKTSSIVRVFQALRIEVNDELNNLRLGLTSAIDKLCPGGRVAVISFHSLEDRIVKNILKDKLRQGVLKEIAKKPVQPSLSEIRNNPRARSAKLRWGVRHG